MGKKYISNFRECLSDSMLACPDSKQQIEGLENHMDWALFR